MEWYKISLIGAGIIAAIVWGLLPLLLISRQDRQNAWLDKIHTQLQMLNAWNERQERIAKGEKIGKEIWK